MEKEYIVFKVDAATEAYEVVHRSSAMADRYSHSHFSSSFRQYIDADVHPADHGRLLAVSDISSLAGKFSSGGNVLKIEYRDIFTGVPLWHELQITCPGNGYYTFTFIRNDLEILFRHLHAKVDEEYFSLVIADIDTGLLRSVKASQWYEATNTTVMRPYTESLLEFAAGLPDEAREFFTRISDLEYVKKELAHEDKRRYTYYSPYADGGHWVTMITYVLTRHDDGTPSTFTLGFMLSDSLYAKNMELNQEISEQKRKLEDDLMVMGSLASDYQAIYYIDVATGETTIIRGDDDSKRYRNVFDAKMPEDFFKGFRDYYVNTVVEEEDRDKVNSIMNLENIYERFKTHNHVSVNYRVRRNTKDVVYTEMRIFKAHEVQGKLNSVIATFRLTSDDMRETIDLKEQLERSMQMIGGMASEYTGLYHINLSTNTFKVYSIDGKRIPDTKAVVQRFTDSMDAFSAWASSGAIHPDDRQALLDLNYDVIRERLANSKKFSVRFRRNYNGQYLWSELDIIKYEGKHEKPESIIIGFAERDKEIRREIEHRQQLLEAERKVEQARYETMEIFSNAFLGTYVSAYYVNLNDCSQIVFNRASYVENDFGHIDNYLESITAYINKYVHEDDREKMLQAVQPEYIRRKLHESTDGRFTIYMRDTSAEEIKWYRFIVTHGADDDHAGLAFIDVTSKILEDQERSIQLQEALAMAQSANRAKTTFLNNMSHDIRTPMNAIISFTSLALSHIDKKEQVHDYLGKISKSSNHLLSLINDVLDMSRIESGKMNLHEKQENLSEILHALRDIVLAEVHAKQLDFFMDSVDVADEDIICDKLRLNQVLLNILSNSIKYTPAGGTISLRITQHTVSHAGYGTYHISVKDNGMGMSQEFLKTIFEPFARVNTADVSRIQGTGLGMAITKSIVEMMGGKIQIVSEEGKGTEVMLTFEFKLHSGRQEPECIPGLAGKRCLVVDDDINTCQSVSNMLRNAGMRPEWCTSGKEAVVRAQEAARIDEKFQLFFLDLQMPNMNGIEATRKIRRETGNEAPIIILTTYDWSDIADEASEAGVTGFVSKPLFPSDLNKALCQYCKAAAVSSDGEVITPEEKHYNFAGKRILLVEDNELNIEIAKIILEEEGFVVDIAQDGIFAVDKVKNATPGQYDLVLMDIQMPIMNGLEATKKIRSLEAENPEMPRLPIIAMTANAFEEDRRTALDAGMDEHITKPINIATLKSTIARFICG